MTNFSIETYKANDDSILSVYILADTDDFNIDDAIEFFNNNYKNSESCEFVQKNDESVARYYNAARAVIFHETN